MSLTKNNYYLKFSFISFFYFLIFILKRISSVPSCSPGINNCIKCNPLTKLCAICNNPEIYIPNENGGCDGILKCKSGKNYCSECDMNSELCKICEKGYYPDENGSCTYTENCKISFKGECIECNKDYIKIGKKGEWQICKYIGLEDFIHCKKINYEKGYCDLCEENYFLTSENKCVKTKNCKESIYGNCISCIYGYFYNKKDEKCEVKNWDFAFCKQSLDNKTCEICDDNNYLNEEGICTPSKFCSKSVNGTCIKCIYGYYLSGNSVCTQTDNCSNGDKDIGMCNSCKSKYYLDTKDYLCKTHLDINEFKHCILSEEGKCIKCENGFYLGEDFRCSFTKNCSESYNGTCLSCSKNFYLDLNNNCTDIEHCIYSSDVYYKCLECEDGYYFSKKYRQCYEYNNNSKYNNCKLSCDQLEQCCICKDNFYLRSNDSLCFSNLEKGPFYKCIYSTFDGKDCIECAEPYFLGAEDYLCNLVDNCAITEDEYRCEKCMDYYCLDAKKGTCIENYKIENETNLIYFACNKTNEEANACEECVLGFEVGQEGLCVNYDNCTERQNGNGICLKCQKDYCANDNFGCILNYYPDPNCIRCNNNTDFYWCTECKAGYKINVTFGFCEMIINDTKNYYDIY